MCLLLRQGKVVGGPRFEQENRWLSSYRVVDGKTVETEWEDYLQGTYVPERFLDYFGGLICGQFCHTEAALQDLEQSGVNLELTRHIGDRREDEFGGTDQDPHENMVSYAFIVPGKGPGCWWAMQNTFGGTLSTVTSVYDLMCEIEKLRGESSSLLSPAFGKVQE